MIGVILTVACCMLSCCGCLRGGQGVQWLAGRHLAGVRAAADLEARCGGVWRDRDAESRVNRVGRRLVRVVPDLRCTCSFRLLDSDEVNAVSLPSGSVYLTRELYTRLTTDDLLAAALAHELGHVVAKDGLKRLGDDQVRLERETAADARAARFLADAGFDRRALADLLVLIQDRQPKGWARSRVAALASLDSAGAQTTR